MRPIVIVASLLLTLPLLRAAPTVVVHDNRLQISLFAADPDIVTPIGLAINQDDELFVLESHTHSRPADYTGPKGHRIKRFADTDRDGSPDAIGIFADNIDAGMNLAFSPDGQLYVVCARDVWWIQDEDRDGTSESRRRVLRVETSNLYPHSCLLGITFSRDGWLYVSRGNNGSAAYTIHGTDGSTVSGYGDGGSILRCRPDGSKLTEVATGFWNPFDLKFDHAGRLLAVDNDPDARGPNRIVHVVNGGDYGYKSIYGGGGNHPFQSWDGELPGTLPFVAGTGEAPSGLLDCALASFPADYRDNLLVTLWNENTIARYVTRPKGTSITATHTVLISGGQDFRPVALAADTRGDLYITDWVLVAYPNHGRGRIWKLTSKPEIERSSPRAAFQTPRLNPNEEFLDHLAGSNRIEDYPMLRDSLLSQDPFVRHAASMALSKPAFRSRVLDATLDGNSKVRLGALLALLRARIDDPAPVAGRLLSDPDLDVRRMALVWIAEAGLVELRDALDKAIEAPEVSATLFETFLATLQYLDPSVLAARADRRPDKANRIRGRLEPGLLESIVLDQDRPVPVRALALKRLANPVLEQSQSPVQTQGLLLRLVRDAPPPLQREAVRSLSQNPNAETAAQLQEIALSSTLPVDVRAEALSGLAWQHDVDLAPLIPLLNDTSEAIQIEAVRLLRAESNPTILAALKALHTRMRAAPDLPVAQQLAHALSLPSTEAGPKQTARPTTPDTWKRALARGGDLAAGERLFFAPQTSCSKCHLLHSRGGRLGPDLSNIGQSVTRDQIIHSILRPSDQFPPQYQAWTVETKDGEIHQGLQLDHKDRGAIELFTTAGRTVRFNGDEIETYAASPYSLMPDGLEAAWTIEDFRNLVAFLESLK